MDDEPADFAPAARTARGARRRQEPRPPRPPPRPLNTGQLAEMALGYAARYATTAAKLARYLARKLRERGWDGDEPPDVPALAARLAGHGYVDDRVYAQTKARGMAARGLGARRVRGALSAAGVCAEDQDAALAPEDADTDPATAALATAIAFARRRRLGPFAREPAPDPARRQKDMAAMLRAGHGMDTARQVLRATDAAALEALIESAAPQ